MASTPVGHALVKALVAEGVTTAFGIPGGHILPIYDAVYSTPQLRSVLVRHEHAAAAMAAAYAQLTGTPAVVLAMAGPGVTNVVTAVAEAFVGAAHDHPGWPGLHGHRLPRREPGSRHRPDPAADHQMVGQGGPSRPCRTCRPAGVRDLPFGQAGPGARRSAQRYPRAARRGQRVSPGRSTRADGRRRAGCAPEPGVEAAAGRGRRHRGTRNQVRGNGNQLAAVSRPARRRHLHPSRHRPRANWAGACPRTSPWRAMPARCWSSF